MTDLCPHDDDPNSCPPCVNARRPKPPPSVTYGHRFLARFDGHCPDCDLPIHRGQAVRLVTIDDRNRTLHDRCTP